MPASRLRQPLKTAVASPALVTSDGSVCVATIVTQYLSNPEIICGTTPHNPAILLSSKLVACVSRQMAFSF